MERMKNKYAMPKSSAQKHNNNPPKIKSGEMKGNSMSKMSYHGKMKKKMK